MATILVSLFLLAAVALLAVVVWTVHAADLDLTGMDLPTPRLVCDLELCDKPSAVMFDAGTLDGYLFICDGHAAAVSEWAPVAGVRTGIAGWEL